VVETKVEVVYERKQRTSQEEEKASGGYKK
jgi:hypothetical protein